MDISKESKETLEMYGARPGDGSFASNCLLARRLAERGVRFIQLYHRGWDHHGNVKGAISNVSKLVDQGSAALVKDLKERGMLEDTLIVWGGEFGRTPMAQGSGRDHHIAGFSMGWPAEASKAASLTAIPTNLATTRWKMSSTPATSMPPCSTNLGLSQTYSPTNFKASTSASLAWRRRPIRP